MSSMDDFLNNILDRKRTAEAHGLVLDVMVLHQDFYDTLMKALGASPQASSCFEIRQDPREKDRKDIFLHGVKVMWSGDRMPVRQAWYRYSNPNYKAKT